MVMGGKGAQLRLVRPPVTDDDATPVESRRQRIDRFAGYSLHRVIARGGMAAVWHATAPDGREVALKRMLPALAANPQTVLMFSDEALLGMRMKHPCLIHTFALDVHEQEPFLVMEYVAGPSVADLLNRAARPMRLAAATHIVLQLLEGLAALHDLRDDNGAPLGVVHRDVSPNNILLTAEGDVKLGDFGIALITCGARPASANALQGKIGYMAPEQLAGEPLDARTDLFAAGVVLLELLTGRRAFARDHELATLAANYAGYARGLDSDLPTPLARVVQKALAQRRDDRFASAVDFAHALEEASQELGHRSGREQLAQYLRESESDGNATAGSTVRGVVRARRTAGSRPSLPPGAGIESRRAASVAREARALAKGAAFEHDPSLPASIERRRGLLAFHFGQPAELPERRRLTPAATRRMVRELVETRASGLLIARTPRRETRVFFDDGAPVFTACTDECELLGERLVRLGQATPAYIELAVERALRWDCPLGEALVDMGAVSARSVFVEIRRQMRERLRDLLSWKSGELGFVRNARPGLVAVRFCPSELEHGLS
ncbi:MAG: serine/threonine protein kinase [Polyangiaceae bacterium]|nr:serine/threonine protein kinase [Polyangiaceae bacterium]